jgi:hypothetical protein
VVLTDDLLARLLTFPNVLVTGHQVFSSGSVRGGGGNSAPVRVAGEVVIGSAV